MDLRCRSRRPRWLRGSARVLLFALFGAGSSLCPQATPVSSGRTIRVPQDHRLISLAVAAARPGDIVEVDDGYYFETDVVLDKPITLRSRNLFGAVVRGSSDPRAAVFIVRAAVDISGFVIKDSEVGILQRDSPDVEWAGRDLAFFGLAHAVYVNDREARVGSARLSRIIIDRCRHGVATNDAREVRVDRCLVSRTGSAFTGSNHVSFGADQAVLWDCPAATHIDGYLYSPLGGTNRIDLGRSFWSFGPIDSRDKIRDFPRRLNQIFAPDAGAPAEPLERKNRREALLLALTGSAALDSGDLEGAETHFRQALALAGATGASEARWQADLGLARTAEARGDSSAAIERYGHAVDFIETVGARLPLWDQRSRFREDKITVYEILIGLLLERHAQAPLAGYDRQALSFAERSKAQGILAGLRRADSDRTGTSGEEFRREERRVSLDVNRIQIDLQAPDATPAAWAALLRRLEKAEAERRNYFLRVRQGSETGGVESVLLPPSLEEIRRGILDESTALLEYVLGENRSFVFLLTREGLWTAPIPKEGILRPQIMNYLRFLTLREPRSFMGWAGGKKLRESLLGPFESRLAGGIKKILIVPDGLLHYLPFETLVGGPEGKRFLVEDFEIGYGPSASVLLDLRRRTAPAGYAMEFLGLADPSSFRINGLSPGGEQRFPRLSFAVAEVTSIGRLFPAAKRTVLVGREARESRLKSLPLADYRVIHLAAHGFFEDGFWWRSALLIRGEENAAEDGFLQPADLFPLRFSPELLVLSGCRTGGGSLLKGEGVMGLSGAFLRCGVRSLLLSLWSVDDKATARFMKQFYGYWRRGRTKGEALRRAKIEALRSGHPPFVWAPFVLLGD